MRRLRVSLLEGERHVHRVARRRDEHELRRLDRLDRVSTHLIPGPESALLVTLTRVGHEDLAVPAEDANTDDVDPRRGARLVRHGTRPVLAWPAAARVEEVLVSDGGHHDGGTLLDVASRLVGGAPLALCMLLRLARGRRRP